MKAEEQTPIRAEEFLNKISILCDGYTYEETKKDILKVMEQYAELRIQQEREKWKEEVRQEVFKALSRGAYLAITKIDVVNTGIEPYFEEYYENEVKPRIESK